MPSIPTSHSSPSPPHCTSSHLLRTRLCSSPLCIHPGEGAQVGRLKSGGRTYQNQTRHSTLRANDVAFPFSRVSAREIDWTSKDPGSPAAPSCPRPVPSGCPLSSVRLPVRPSVSHHLSACRPVSPSPPVAVALAVASTRVALARPSALPPGCSVGRDETSPRPGWPDRQTDLT